MKKAILLLTGIICLCGTLLGCSNNHSRIDSNDDPSIQNNISGTEESSLVDYNKDYISAIIESLRYKYEYDVDAVFIGNSSINWDVTETLDTLTHVTLDKDYIDEEVKKCDAYSVYELDSIKRFGEQLISTLVGYDSYLTF